MRVPTPDVSVVDFKFLAKKSTTPEEIAGLIKEVLPAQQIIDNMVTEASEILTHNASLVVGARARL